MSNYTKTTDFQAKDSLPAGDSNKVIRGSEFETEFDNIATAVNSKADTANATLTGTTTFETISDGVINVTAFVDEDNMASNSATLVPTQQSVKSYVDSQITANNELSEVLSNGNTTGGSNISFGDNDKAVFGAGNDLQIYHDGSGSFINDTGTGDLHIRASNTLRLQNSAGQLYAYGFNGGEFALYHNNAQKLATTSAGIDVTGTIVSYGVKSVDNLELSADHNSNSSAAYSNIVFKTDGSERARIDSSGRLGLGTSSPSEALEVNGNVVVSGSNGITLSNVNGRIRAATNLEIIIDHDDNNLGSLIIKNGSGSSIVTIDEAGNLDTDGSITSDGLDVDGSIKLDGNYPTGSNNVALGNNAFNSVTTGSNSVLIGNNAGTAITTGSYNTAVGSLAFDSSQTGSYNVALGASALRASTTGDYGVAVGTFALQSNTTGSRNVALGVNALKLNTTGQYNTALGYNALNESTTASHNVAIGNETLADNTTGQYNIAIGSYALFDSTTSGYNVAIGYSAAYSQTTGSQNVAIGKDASRLNQTGTSNTAVGYQALENNTVSGNTAVGNNALTANTTGAYNTAVGYAALDSNQTGTRNDAFGVEALYSNTGNYNSAFGSRALYSNTTGSENVAIGYQTLYFNTTGEDNTGLGQATLYANTTGSYNTAAGRLALSSNTTGGDNTGIGRQALQSSTTASQNTALGTNSGRYTTTGGSNVYIGYDAGQAGTTAQNNVAIGRSALRSNELAERNVAIGRSALTNLAPTSVNHMYQVAVGYNAGASITTGTNNTAVGGLALDALTTGDGNVAIGVSALGAATTCDNNVAVGKSAMSSATTSENNVVVGNDALASVTTSGHNIAIGRQALYASTAANNTAVGYQALYANTTGTDNVAVGKNTLDANTTGYQNIALGNGALGAVTTGANNVAIGLAGREITTGNGNIAIGRNALISNVSSNYNIAIGYDCLRNNTSDTNTAVGHFSLDASTTGSNNTAVGYGAGGAVTTGIRNTFIGHGAGGQISTGHKNTILGRYTGNQHGLDIRTSDNHIVLSDGDGNPRVVVDDSGNTGIGTVSPSSYYATTLVVDAPDEDGITVVSPNTGRGYLSFADGTSGSSQYRGYFAYDHANDSLQVATGGAERLRITSSGKVGIGTSSPLESLDVRGKGYFNNGGALYVDSQSSGVLFAATGASRNIAFEVNGARRFDIKPDGKVGIGTTSPSKNLHITSATGNVAVRLDRAASSTATTSIELANGGTGNPTTIIESGGTASSSNGIVFKRGNSGSETERMRLDSSGNLLVGTTDTNVSDNTTGGGININGDGEIKAAKNGTVLNLNRLTTDGEIVRFKKGGSTVGSIFSHSSGNMGIGTGATGVLFAATSNSIQPWNPSSNAARDATQDLGIASNRFKDLHLSGSVNAAQVNLKDAGGTSRNVLDLDGSSNLKIGTGSSVGTRAITFFTENTEQMRLDASGNLLVGTTAPNGNGITLNNEKYIYARRVGGTTAFFDRHTTDGDVVGFRKSGTQVGSISVTSSATTYNTSSDERLKDNIVDAPSASDDIDAIQVRSFDWKADGSHQKYGMVAQELQGVAPEAVSQGETEEDMMGVDYSKLVPMLVKEIQSLRARVAQLEGES